MEREDSVLIFMKCGTGAPPFRLPNLHPIPAWPSPPCQCTYPKRTSPTPPSLKEGQELGTWRVLRTQSGQSVSSRASWKTPRHSSEHPAVFTTPQPPAPYARFEASEWKGEFLGKTMCRGDFPTKAAGKLSVKHRVGWDQLFSVILCWSGLKNSCFRFCCFSSESIFSNTSLSILSRVGFQKKTGK